MAASASQRNNTTPPQPYRPLLPISERILVDMYAQLAAVVGVDGEDEARRWAGRKLTADQLRALDTRPEGATQWLRDADRQARKELLQWYTARFLPGPDDETDPGEPTPGDALSAYGRLIDRPNPETPERQLIEYLKCRRDPVYFIDNYCWLAHPEQGVIPFRLWRWQAWLVHQWRRHNINIMLKARQEGVSELAAATALHLIRFHDTKTALLLSRGEDEAKVLKGRAELMYLNLPPWLQATDVAPDTVRLGMVNMTVFAIHHLDRQQRVRTSRIESLPATKGAGRSRTAALVIFDEHAHMLWAEETWGAAKPTADAGGCVLSISSANGLGNLFADLWEAATTTPGGAGLFAVFLSWRRHPQRDAAWYAAQLLLAEKSNKVPLLHQEYPSEPGEAFIQSGRPVFEQKVLVEHETRIREELAAGFTPYQSEHDGLTFYEAPVGPHCDLATHREVAEGYRYILSADVAEGLAHGDWDDASVLCRETGREVATLHGHWPPHVYAQKLYDLGIMYNTALLVVERNSIGNTVLTALVTGDAHKDAETLQPTPYPNLYHHQEPLVAGRRPEARPGWPTNVTTKPLAVHALGAALAAGSYQPRDMAALTEMRIFSYNDNGSMSAPSGKHDDRVMSRAPGVYLLAQPDPVLRTLSFIADWASLVSDQAKQAQLASAPGGIPGSTVR